VTLLMYLAAMSAERTRGGKLENHERCPGSAPVSWIPASECGTGACGADWNTSHPLMVPRCAGRGTLRHYNRSSVMHCLRQLSSMSGKPRYRILMGGVSNALHIFRALQDDDSLEPWERERSRKAHPSCPPLSTVRLRAFAPHALDYHALQVVTHTTAVLHQSSPSCWLERALGGGQLWAKRVVEASPEAYDAVVVHAGSWDATYTAFNASGLEDGFRGMVSTLLNTWRNTRVVLVTTTPCGGVLEGTLRRYTPQEACDHIQSVNDAMRRIAQAHPARVALLDAHQMTLARPRVNESGSPPGIWMAQSHGLHFALASSWAARERARAAQPPLAHNEMPRAIANRIWDILCPFPTMSNPSQVKGRSHRAARSHARPAR